MADSSNISTILEDLEPGNPENNTEEQYTLVVTDPEPEEVPPSHSNLELGSATESENAFSIHVFENEDQPNQDALVVLEEEPPHDREREPNEPETDPSLQRNPHGDGPRPVQRVQYVYNMALHQIRVQIISIQRRLAELEAQYEEMGENIGRQRIFGMCMLGICIVLGSQCFIFLGVRWWFNRRRNE